MARKKQADMIVRVRFSDGKVMMFGNSYKPWNMQFEEFVLWMERNNKLESVEEVHISDSPWVSWGGLKWCAEDSFQHQLNREGCQVEEPDNLNPRQYKDMYFYKDQDVRDKVIQIVSDIKVGIY